MCQCSGGAGILPALHVSVSRAGWKPAPLFYHARMESITLRPATRADAEFIRENLCSLAEVEGRPGAAKITAARIAEILFGERPPATCQIVMHADVPIGHAWYYMTVPTFTGVPVLFLEDIVVRPEHRSKGVGRRVMEHLAQIAREHRCDRVFWRVVADNDAAVRFYERLGAARVTGVETYWMRSDAL